MTAFAMTLPLARRNPTYIPRRDLAAAIGDDLILELTLVEADRPDAAPLDMVGDGLGVQFVLYRRPVWHACHDYGLGYMLDYNPPASDTAQGVVVDGAAGRVNVTIPEQTCAGRMWWQVQLDYEGGASVIAHGALHLRRGVAAPAHAGLLDDDGAAITDDALEALEV